MDVYERMKSLAVKLPQPPTKGGVYAPVKFFGKNLAYVSGCGPVIDKPTAGKLGAEYTLEEGQAFAKQCMLNVLAVLESHIGDLNRVKSCVKVLAFVAGTDTFYQQPQVANGGTQLLVDLFGVKAGEPSRSAIGVNALPGNIPVEIEALFELKE